jgi:hypothetical protein
MSIVKTGLAPDPLRYVLQRLRPLDRKELFATRTHDSPERAADEIMRACAPFGTLFWHNHEPVAALGFFPMWPGVVSVWAFGSSLWGRVVQAMTRHIVNEMGPELLKRGVHRAECRTLTERQDSERWLRALGGRAEGILREFGRNREDFTVYAWTDRRFIPQPVH